MLAHYFRAAFASIRRSPGVALVNIVTLSLGLACFTFAYAVVRFWDGADGHFANADRTYVVTSDNRLRGNGEIFRTGLLPYVNRWFAEYLRADYPQIEAIARVARADDSLPVAAEGRAVRARAYSADAAFLEIFDLPFVAGDSRAALREPSSVILTAEAARELFGNANPLGKPLLLANAVDATVTGVIGPIPEPSHMGRSAAAPLSFDLLMTRELYDAVGRALFEIDPATQPEDWFNATDITYVLMPLDGSLTPAELVRQFPEFTRRHVPADFLADSELHFGLMPVADVLGNAVSGSLFLRRSGLSVPLLLLFLGALVLAVACVDFANLGVARAAARTREFGIRKAIGAQPRQIFYQYVVEVALLSAVALVIAAALAFGLSPVIERATGIALAWSLLDVWFAVSMAVVLVLVTFAAGTYPAAVLARSAPAAATRSPRMSGTARPLAPILVAVQYSAAAFLLIAVAVVYLQNETLERTGLATTGDPLLVIDNEPRVTGVDHDTLRAELLRLPQVRSATALQSPPWMRSISTLPITGAPGSWNVERVALVYLVGYDFFDTFGVQLLAGRAFDPGVAFDVAAVGRPPPVWTPTNIVIDRALAEAFGFTEPEAALGHVFYPPNAPSEREFRVIGVVDNRSLDIANRYGAQASIYLFNPGLNYHVVRLARDDVAGGLDAIDSLWQTLAPNVAVQRRFADDYFNESYESFLRINQAFGWLAGIALAIATIGLFAMAAETAGRRVREIGVRKTLGATDGQVVRMLLTSFTLPVVVANVIAWPFAYIAARTYLDLFIAPVELTWLPFAACLGATVLVACIAVGGQTWRAARAQPARVLRHE